jgi:hypothetical protein
MSYSIPSDYAARYNSLQGSDTSGSSSYNSYGWGRRGRNN